MDDDDLNVCSKCLVEIEGYGYPMVKTYLKVCSVHSADWALRRVECNCKRCYENNVLYDLLEKKGFIVSTEIGKKDYQILPKYKVLEDEIVYCKCFLDGPEHCE